MKKNKNHNDHNRNLKKLYRLEDEIIRQKQLDIQAYIRKSDSNGKCHDINCQKDKISDEKFCEEHKDKFQENCDGQNLMQYRTQRFPYAKLKNVY